MALLNNLSFKGGNPGAVININEKQLDSIMFIDVNASFDEPVIPQKITVEWIITGDDSCSVWNPFMRCHAIRPDWGSNTMKSRLASGMPVQQVINYTGKNKACVAVSDVDTPINILMGYNEETANIICSVDFFTLPTEKRTSYSAQIRVDMRCIEYYNSIYDTVNWWENQLGYKSAYVPEHAKLPMDSLWYSFHQNLNKAEILKQCAASKELGMKTVIIDDGWQTDDNNRGYAFCGDWRVCERKMGDMSTLVEDIHKIGMKVILWYSVPFMGVNCEKYNEFKNMLLDESGNEETFFALDPRYKKVREYLCSVYENAVKEWGLDGLKLDFIDSFVLKGKSLESDPLRDYESLESAIHALMSEIKVRLTAINPEILIEFRQSYVGPSIRKYGNMLRVGDCPGDILTNRSQIINLRFTSGKTAVHSDMIMWNMDDTAENAALQFANIIFAVPQISVLFEKLPKEHIKMLRFYISFWNRYRDVLLEGKLTAYNPETEYSQACSLLGDVSVTAVYTNPVVEIKTSEGAIVNASAMESIILKNSLNTKYKVMNCIGEEVAQGIVNSDLCEVKVPTAGIILF